MSLARIFSIAREMFKASERKFLLVYERDVGCDTALLRPKFDDRNCLACVPGWNVVVRAAVIFQHANLFITGEIRRTRALPGWEHARCWKRTARCRLVCTSSSIQLAVPDRCSVLNGFVEEPRMLEPSNNQPQEPLAVVMSFRSSWWTCTCPRTSDYSVRPACSEVPCALAAI